jgi:hypothetical protein
MAKDKRQKTKDKRQKTKDKTRTSPRITTDVHESKNIMSKNIMSKNIKWKNINKTRPDPWVSV